MLRSKHRHTYTFSFVFYFANCSQIGVIENSKTPFRVLKLGYLKIWTWQVNSGSRFGFYAFFRNDHQFWTFFNSGCSKYDVSWMILGWYCSDISHLTFISNTTRINRNLFLETVKFYCPYVRSIFLPIYTVYSIENLVSINWMDVMNFYMPANP